MTRVIDVAVLIDKARLSGTQIRVFVLCALVTLLDGFDAQAIAFVAAALAAKFSVPVSAFGPIFGAGTVGLALGALLLPPLADRYGRKWQIILATFLFGVFSLATVWISSLEELAVLRFLTGLGVGAAVPNLVPLTAEYAPQRIRAMLITTVTVSWPLGAVLGGLVSAHLIPAYGWESVFYLGGILPLLLVLVLMRYLPESIRFRVARGDDSRQIVAALQAVVPQTRFEADDRFSLPEAHLSGFSVRHLFSAGRSPVTVLLWIPFFMNFLVLFFMFNWLPPLMQQAGLPLQRAIIAVVAFNLGGIFGGVLLGRWMDRHGNYRVMGLAYLLGAIFVASIGFLDFSLPLLLSAIFLAGLCSVGTQVCGNALAASLYPTAVRSTGVGWAYGIGRLGSIVGPVVGGVLIALHWSLRELFLVAAIPLLFGALALVLLARANAKLLRGRG